MPDLEGAALEELAIEAGLIYAYDDREGITRVRRGRGFAYLGADGRPVSRRDRARIGGLVIPPAWTDVWISPEANGHILATGRDAAGRKQYVYHPDWEDLRDEVKFERMTRFGRAVGTLRRRLDLELRAPGLAKEKVIALALAVLDRTLIRVGNRRYAIDNDSYGLTTLRNDHVEVVRGRVRIEFSAKGGADRQVAFSDRRLARLISRYQDLGASSLFSYESEDGSASIGSADLNSHLSLWMGARYTAKDFRTWGANSSLIGYSMEEIDGDDPEETLLAALDLTAGRLGNTRQVCRSSYVHPEVIAAFEDGRLPAAWQRSRTGRWVSRSESALNRLLAE